MQAFIVRRLLLIMPTLVIISIIIFGLVRFVPGDMVDKLADQRGGIVGMDANAIRERMGLNVPIHIQYARWAGSLLKGDFGKSMWNRRSAVSEVARRYPITVELAGLSITISTLWGLAVGVISATKQDKFIDYLLRVISIIGLSVPYFWTSIIVLVFSSIYFNWSPPPIYIPLSEDPIGNIKLMIIPSLIFSFFIGAPIARMTRAMMLEVMNQDYIRTAKAKGLGENLVIYRHALKNAFMAVITIIGLQAAWAMSGLLIIEQVWGLPGIGKYLIEVIIDRDYPMLQALVMFCAFIVILINLIVDLSYAWLDPRGRLS